MTKKQQGELRRWIAFSAIVIALFALIMLGKSIAERSGVLDDTRLIGSDSTIDVGLIDAPKSLDIRTEQGTAVEQALLGNVYETLIGRDENNKLIPSLANSWSTSKDGRTVTLHLRGNTTFSNGDALDADDLVRILKEPKNAILKQYQALFGLDHVQLTFTDDALRAVAEETLKRETGARGLRSVMEEVLTTLMFEVPSDPKIEKITITSDTVKKGAQPEIVYNPEKKAARLMPQAKAKPQRRKVNA